MTEQEELFMKNYEVDIYENLLSEPILSEFVFKTIFSVLSLIFH